MIRELRKWTRQVRGYDEAGQVGERKEKDPALRRLRASAAGAVLITALLVLPSAPAASAAGLFGDGGLLDGIASGAADLGAGLPGGWRGWLVAGAAFTAPLIAALVLLGVVYALFFAW